MPIVHKPKNGTVIVWESPDSDWTVSIPADGTTFFTGYIAGNRLLQAHVSDGWTVYYADIDKNGQITEDEMFQWRVPKKVREATYSALRRAYRMYGPVKSTSGKGKMPIKYMVKVYAPSPYGGRSQGPQESVKYFSNYDLAIKDAKSKWAKMSESKKQAGYWVNLEKLSGGPYFDKKDIPANYYFTPLNSFSLRSY